MGDESLVAQMEKLQVGEARLGDVVRLSPDAKGSPIKMRDQNLFLRAVSKNGKTITYSPKKTGGKKEDHATTTPDRLVLVKKAPAPKVKTPAKKKEFVPDPIHLEMTTGTTYPNVRWKGTAQIYGHVYALLRFHQPGFFRHFSQFCHHSVFVFGQCRRWASPRRRRRRRRPLWQRRPRKPLPYRQRSRQLLLRKPSKKLLAAAAAATTTTKWCSQLGPSHGILRVRCNHPTTPRICRRRNQCSRQQRA
eukprot:SAG22_NODE_4118_length_1379_cov_1.432813_1_plen_248_part_00